MRCPACAGENAPASKFCGVCGGRLASGPATVPPEAGPSRPPAAPPASAPASGGSSVVGGGGSLAGSLRLPEARASRVARSAIVLGLDLALVIGGVVLATRRSGPTATVSADPGVTSGVGAGTGSNPGPGSGSSAVVGPNRIDRDPGPGRILVPPIGPGLPSTRPDAAATIDAGRWPDAAGPAVTVDAGDSAPLDAPEVAEVDAAVEPGTAPGSAVDAAAVAPESDATVAEVDAGPEAAVGADAIMRQLNRHLVASSGRLDRCYANATKSLPPDEALRGQVDIGLAVLLTGVVADVTVLKNTTGSEQLGACSQAVVASWTFSSHDGAEPLHLVRSFTFGPK